MGSAVLGEGILAIDYDDKGRRVMEGYIWWAVRPERASPKLIPNDKVMGGFGALFSFCPHHLSSAMHSPPMR